MSFFLELQKNIASTPVEKCIINYIINHPNEVIEMTMEDLARETYTSRSTISRFCKKNGYDGFNSLKIQLAIELNMFLKDEVSVNTSLPFDKGDDSLTIVDKIISQIHTRS
ncbi:MurR/RpiR family transcriptional regulator [Dielma fastidiosa]|uniref:RpiR family transcriptional regulator n=1 Tax=Dielma fastidiosa TaxID=1034346 RepID=A0A318KCP8_9FIRM|nr:MurR/RpiR family transcriptional regulator [Dielma fastidiosa]PXX73689.1 RpiR family transcriptional regulator [Dielma fastidiosa]